MKRIFFLVLIGFIISGCGEKTPNNTPTLMNTSIPTNTSFPTNTSIPTNTSTPNPTNTPTQTPSPTFGIGSTQISPKDQMEMVYVPAGEFVMGSESGGNNHEEPIHTVYLDEYWIDKYDVTNAQFLICVQAGECDEPGGNYFGNNAFEDHPVVFVSWFDAEDYCEWAGRRLPTEAEWEKAARGNNGRTYPWGEGISCQKANYNNCTMGTTAVGTYLDGASPYGALDMTGNVWKWVADWYDEDYYSSSPSNNPQGPSSGTYRVLRPGSWDTTDWGIRSTFRLGFLPEVVVNYIGFRCVVSP